MKTQQAIHREWEKKEKEYKKAHEKLDQWIEKIWKHPKTAKLPTETAITFNLICKLQAQLNEERINSFIEYVERLNPVIMLLMAQKALDKFGTKFSGSKKWVDLFTRHYQRYFDVTKVLKKN